MDDHEEDTKGRLEGASGYNGDIGGGGHKDLMVEELTKMDILCDTRESNVALCSQGAKVELDKTGGKLPRLSWSLLRRHVHILGVVTL